MKKLFTILFLTINISVFAQQGLLMPSNEIDSTQLQLNRQAEYFQLTHNVNNNLILQDLKLPKFDFENTNIPLSLLYKPQQKFTSLSLMGDGSSYPYFHNAEILSSSVHQLSNKFIVGGFSYGANSILSSPLPNQNSSYFDTYGSTMFVKYKVSKKFSIETSISVERNPAIP